MRYRTNHGLLIEAETSLDIVRRLREASWSEQGLSDQAVIEAVADRVYEQGIHVSTVSPDIFVAGLLSAGLLTREIEGARSNETSEDTEQSQNYWVKQLSKPSVICLLGRLRPMKTMRLSRFSSFFHGL
jgi:hypothetical protein